MLTSVLSEIQVIALITHCVMQSFLPTGHRTDRNSRVPAHTSPGSLKSSTPLCVFNALIMSTAAQDVKIFTCLFISLFQPT